MKTIKTVVIGAGVGGLTAGALLLKAGYQVTVLESQTYPGGCAGTYYHKKFCFDAGATLAGGFSAGGPHARLAETLGLTWPIRPADPAWSVLLPNGRLVTQYALPEQWQTERLAAFPQAESFWHKQEQLADISWDISSRPFPWPPQSAREFLTLAQAMRPRTFLATPYLFSSMADFAPKDDPMFKAFLDAQLLIAAQTTSDHTNALYGAAALDLPRRGVNHIQGGIGSIAQTLVDWIRANGGEVLYRQEVTHIDTQNGQATGVHTKKKAYFPAHVVLGNLTPWALHDLLGDGAPVKLKREVTQREATWGAFTLYLGLDESKLGDLHGSHFQVVQDHERPLGEGNTVFVSLSDEEDTTRAPKGMRAATLSTHTAIQPWWDLRHGDSEQAYLERREQYTERLLAGAEKVIPNIRQAITLCLPGTPVTFEFYTRRPGGMVGGFPQTSIFKVRGPHTGIPNVWLVGDSIFPGQSTAGVTLGGMRVATAVLQSKLTPSSLHQLAPYSA